MLEKESDKNKAKKYTIEELSNLTGFSRRTIRYYIQENIIKPPSGRGRGGFYYNSQGTRFRISFAKQVYCLS